MITANVSLSDWAIFLSTLIPLLASATIAIISAIRNVHTSVNETNASLQLPSNGTHIGAAVEGIAQVQHMAVQLQNPETDIPSAIKIARDLTPADAPQRRADDIPNQPPANLPESGTGGTSS